MEKIIIERIDKNTLSTKSTECEGVSIETYFKEIQDENLQYMIALADFLGYEPTEVLNLEW